jgi:VanZ family protein
MKIIKASFFLFLIVVTYYSLKSPDSGDLPTNDKVGHFLAYFVLAGNLFLICDSLYQRQKALLFLVLYGLLMEFIQSYIPGRDASLLDIIANSSGTLLGLGFIYVFQGKILKLLRALKLIS